jgi:predicted DNA-binding protein
VKRRTSITLSEEVFEKLKELSEETGLDRSWLVETSVLLLLHALGRAPPPRQAAPARVRLLARLLASKGDKYREHLSVDVRERLDRLASVLGLTPMQVVRLAEAVLSAPEA